MSPDAPVYTRKAATAAERVGYAGVWTSEIKHDPFLALGLAAVAVGTIELGTGIVFAFARGTRLLHAHPVGILPAVSGGDFSIYARRGRG